MAKQYNLKQCRQLPALTAECRLLQLQFIRVIAGNFSRDILTMNEKFALLLIVQK